eukprot:Rhum_TRINITY_DN12070_c0_g1::Rhum_TRINITY_DN12070_c0_g1_i1::g.48916::m.48916
MSECVVTWGLTGDDSFETSRTASETLKLSELLKQIRSKMNVSKAQTVMVRDDKGRVLDESASVADGSHLTVQILSVGLNKTVHKYMTLDSLFDVPPRQAAQAAHEQPATATPAAAASATSAAPAAATPQPSEPSRKRPRPGAAAPSSNPIPTDLLCPVSDVLLVDAVLLTCCENTVSKSCLAGKPMCPLCNAPSPISAPDKRVQRMAKKFAQ